jgi:hypothetical protein
MSQDMNKLQELWNKQTESIEQNTKISLHAITLLKTQSAKRALQPYLWMNIFSIIVAVMMTLFSLWFAWTYRSTWYEMASGIVIALWSSFVFYSAAKQTEKIINLNFSDAITKVQEALLDIRVSALLYFKLSLMVIPFHMCFMIIFTRLVWQTDIVAHAPSSWITMQFVLAFVFLLVAIALYRYLRPENIDKPWVKMLMKGMGSQTLSAMTEMNELQQLTSKH